MVEKINSLKQLFDLQKKEKAEVKPISQKIGQFTFVTKPHKLKTPIFEGFLAPYWNSVFKKDVGFYIETWGRPLIPSDCDAETKMINIRKLSIHSDMQKETQDHSKWAISIDKSQALVCVGDLNHQTSQAARGGSFFCTSDA